MMVKADEEDVRLTLAGPHPERVVARPTERRR